MRLYTFPYARASTLNQLKCISPALGRSLRLTHGCWTWHLCITDGLSVAQCSLGHVIGIGYSDTISVAWSDRAGHLAAGGVASVSVSGVQSPPDPRWLSVPLLVYILSLSQSIKNKLTNIYIYTVHRIISLQGCEWTLPTFPPCFNSYQLK